jgi:hypothetical protein
MERSFLMKNWLKLPVFLASEFTFHCAMFRISLEGAGLGLVVLSLLTCTIGITRCCMWVWAMVRMSALS